MTVASGRQFLSIPGPTNVPDEVLSAMHRPAVDIYSGELVAVTESCLGDLKRLFSTSGEAFIYAANGHGAWDAALSNVLSRGDKVLVLESGLFAVGWGEMAEMMGIQIEVFPGNLRRAVDAEAVEERLKADSAGEIKAVLVVQVDTASGVVNDVQAIGNAIANAGHEALFMVDAIASLATMPFEMDAWGVDVAVTGSQKGLMMTPGLSFVAAGKRAMAAHKSANLRTRYWDWTFRQGELHYHKYCGTPPEHLLFGQRKAFDMLFAEELDSIFLRHRILARAVRSAIERWSEGGVLEFNVQQPNERSNSTTTVLLNGIAPEVLINFCKQHCGVTIGIGIGPFDGRAFRIAHMGHVNAPMILGTLGAVETALSTLGIDHGHGGVQAAVDSISEALKEQTQTL